MANQAILVPQISSVPAHEAVAGRMLRWLIHKNIVDSQATTCGLAGNRMAYCIAEGARRVVEHPERLPFGQAVNGLQIITKRCIFTPAKGFLEEAGCPHCRREVGEPLFESLDEWFPGDTDNFMCPLCGFEDDINGFLFLQPCGFSNLGFIFNGWGEAVFKPAFVAAFAERLDFKVRAVTVELE
ncbi:sugar ABC transporter ATPase [Pseudomonas sp. NPDC007930]|uniref:sugar ABC transporter ATPase n=1 Tax=Pseudomonas sp. NPDC007930 TaxID=3364417 RepID=UPI0036E7397E